MTTKQQTERSDGLYQPVMDRAIAFIEKLSNAGLNAGIFCGYRSFADQNKMYLQGRANSGDIVTYSSAGTSWHQYGLAFDIAFIDPNGNWTWLTDDDPAWKQAGDIGKSMGFTWGGDFPKILDLGHFEITNGMNIFTEYANFCESGKARVQADYTSAASSV